MNFLEQLAAEWFEYQGFFVLTNRKYGKREKGGYAGEADVLACKPQDGEYVHVETSADADSWPERLRRLEKKFDSAEAWYKGLFGGDVTEVRKIAYVGYTRPKQMPEFRPDVEVRSVQDLVREICSLLEERHPMKAAVPEGFPLLRAMQFVVHYRRGSSEE